MTDIEGSTLLWVGSSTAARQAVTQHNDVVQRQIDRNHGVTVELGREGDSILAVFSRASEAVGCALEIQRGLRREVWPPGIDVKVRIGIHSGEAQLRNGHYIGAPLYRCARLMTLGHGGQILVSKATQQLVAEELPAGASLRDLGEHHLRDISRQEHIYQLAAPDVPVTFPPLRSADADRSNLPNPLTSFVGREADLVAIGKRLTNSRLVTVVGAGGIGKTRLAIELGRRSRGNWPDGVWWIELAAIEDATSIPGAVAAALGLLGSGEPIDAVTAWLEARRALLVMDNCEHLIDACADLCRLVLERCPGVAVLATSREALRLPGEIRWALGPLNEPAELELFEDRAMGVVGTFKISDVNRSVVAHLCRQLDGLPLAIELAASKVAFMNEAQISKELSSSLELLGASRSADRRHRTLSATIDWSYRLLSTPEATLYRRLSVFRGGFTIECVRAVCGDEPVHDVIDAIVGLVEKSMAVVERLEGIGVRYRLLDSQLLYAAQKLMESGEHAEIQRRHYEYFLSQLTVRHISDRAATVAEQIEDESWKRRELQNAWAALRWAVANVEDRGLVLATAVAGIESNQTGAIRAWLTDLVRGAPATPARTWAEVMLSHLAWTQGDYAAALSFAVDAHERAQSIGDNVRVASALIGMGNALESFGLFSEAEQAQSDAIKVLAGLEQDPYERMRLVAHANIGCIYLSRRDYKRARQILQQCVRHPPLDENAWPHTRGSMLESLANADLGCGDYESARRHWIESIEVLREIGEQAQLITCVGGLSRLAAEQHDHRRALVLAGAYSKLRHEFVYKDPPFWTEEAERAEAISRSVVGDVVGNQLIKKGADMDLARAVGYALGSTPGITSDLGLLTRREAEVAQLVAKGLTNRRIASALFLAERTVEGHVERIRGKLGFSSRVELASWATTQNLAAKNEEGPAMRSL